MRFIYYLFVDNKWIIDIDICDDFSFENAPEFKQKFKEKIQYKALDPEAFLKYK